MDQAQSLPNSQARLGPAEGPPSSQLSTSVKDNYDSVKMKYFMSLGMAPAKQTVTVDTPSATHPELTISPTKKERTKTTPAPNIGMMFDMDNEDDDLADRLARQKKRSVSTPIPISKNASNAAAPIAIAVRRVKLAGHNLANDDSEGDDDEQEEGEEIDFYSKIQKQLQLGKKATKDQRVPSGAVDGDGSFVVGTAREQWLSEQQKRRNMPIV